MDKQLTLTGQHHNERITVVHPPGYVFPHGCMIKFVGPGCLTGCLIDSEESSDVTEPEMRIIPWTSPWTTEEEAQVEEDAELCKVELRKMDMPSREDLILTRSLYSNVWISEIIRSYPYDIDEKGVFEKAENVWRLYKQYTFITRSLNVNTQQEFIVDFCDMLLEDMNEDA